VKKFVAFINEGAIEVAAFKLLGASTKRDDDSKIGFFGSGLKYAIAYLVRNNIEFHCWSGDKRINIESRPIELRGQEFQQIFIDGEATSITSEWGINWRAWQIFRELASNVYDENGHIEVRRAHHYHKHEPTQTVIYVDYEHFSEYVENLEEYFRPDIKEEKDVTIAKRRASPMIIYKKGVRVVPEKDLNLTPSLFDYQLADVEISEERIADSYAIEASLFEYMMEGKDSSATMQYLIQLQQGKADFKEMKILEEQCGRRTWVGFKGHWKYLLEVSGHIYAPVQIQDLLIQRYGKKGILERKIIFIPNPIYDRMKMSYRDASFLIYNNDQIDAKRVQVEISEQELERVNFAIKLLKLNFSGFNYPVLVVQFSDADQMGEADMLNKVIYLSNKVFTRGDNYILSTLVEEFIHLHEGARDYTREFQTHACDMIATLLLNGQ